jgi:hypothetical protein
MFRWTGLGSLALLLSLLLGTVILFASLKLAGLGGGPYVFAVLYPVVGIPLNWRLGVALNTDRTAAGRRHDAHTAHNVPVQYWGYMWYPGLAFAALTVGLWRDTGPGLGTASAVLGVVLLVIVAARLSAHLNSGAGTVYTAEDGTQTRIVQVIPPPRAEVSMLPTGTQWHADRLSPSRRDMGIARGWRYRNRMWGGNLAERWRQSYGDAVNEVFPQNEVGGEWGGYPFTIFDTMILKGPLLSRGKSLRTVFMVHLPVALPSVAVIPGQYPNGPYAEGRVGAVPPWVWIPPPDAGRPPPFAEAPPPPFPEYPSRLVTPDVLDLTIRLGLVGWRIEGRDLIWFCLPGVDEYLASRVLERLVAVARAFPADVLVVLC